MKLKTTLLIVLCITLGTSGFAQKKWSGYYFGPDMGLASTKIKIDGYTSFLHNITNLFVQGRGIVVVPGTSRNIAESSTKKTVFTGGLHAGYMYQYKKIVGGIEADVSYFSAKGTQIHNDSLPATLLGWKSGYGIEHTAATRFNQSVRTKLGYTLKNSLAYMTIGYAFSNIKTTANDHWNTSTYWAQPWKDSAPHPTSTTHNFVPTLLNQKESYAVKGLSFGLGYEFELAKNINLALEYRHQQFSTIFNINKSDTMNVKHDSRPIGFGNITWNSQKITFTENQLTARLNINLAYFIKNKTKDKTKNTKDKKEIKGKKK